MSEGNVGGSSARVVSFEESAELIDASQVESCVDLGHSMLYKLSHPELGAIVVVNSSSGSSGLVRI